MLPGDFPPSSTVYRYWLNQYHRLSKDYERLCEMSKATIYYVVMARIILHRLAA